MVRYPGFEALARRVDALVDLALPVVLAPASGPDRWLNLAARRLLGLRDPIARFDGAPVWSVQIDSGEDCVSLGGSTSKLTFEQLFHEARIGRCVDDLRGRLWVPQMECELAVAVSTQQLLDARSHVNGALMFLRNDERASRREAELRLSARVDPLTGLANRRHLTERLDDLRRRRPPDLVAFVAIDVDHFKRCNDIYGHTIGDGVLAALSARLLNEVRAGDTAVRLGGDEFAVLCNVASRGEAEAIAHRILTVFDAPMTVGGISVRLSASIGVAVRNPAVDPFDPGELLDLADMALYDAKQRGRDRVVFAEASVFG